MADNVAVTPGSGADIATDDAGAAGHVQRVKLSIATDGSATPIPADGTDGLLVNLGTNNDVTNAGTFAVQVDGSALTALQLIDDPVAVLGTATYLEATTKGMLAGAVRRDADTSAVNTDNEAAPLLVDARGCVKVEAFSGETLPVSLASVPSHAVTNAGTFATQVDGAALTALQLIDDPVIQDDAAVTAGTTKVMITGGMSVAHGTNPDAADANDGGMFLMNRHRVPFVIGGHPNIISVKHTTITTAVTDAAIITVSAGTKIVVTAFTVTLDNASTVFPTFLMGFGATNTPTTTAVIGAHGGVPAGGGFSRGDGSGIIGIGADGEDLRVTTTGNATGNGLQIVVTYFTIES